MGNAFWFALNSALALVCVRDAITYGRRLLKS